VLDIVSDCKNISKPLFVKYLHSQNKYRGEGRELLFLTDFDFEVRSLEKKKKINQIYIILRFTLFIAPQTSYSSFSIDGAFLR
jgi:hypothetical protein